MIIVISLGGSIVAPASGPNAEFLYNFKQILASWIKAHNSKAIIVVGGGHPARRWQDAYRSFNDIWNRNISQKVNTLKNAEPYEISQSLDRIGIAATRLNAQLVREVFSDLCPQDVVIDPTSDFDINGSVLVAAGWKPGFSTDYDAVLLAERFNAARVINLSNIAQIYNEDPRKNPNAIPLSKISYDLLLKMTGEIWNPGANVPFDPIAAKKAQTLGLEIVFALGTDLENFHAILENKKFVGTLIQNFE